MKATETSEKVFERTMSKYVENKGGMAVKLLSQFINGLPDRMYLLPGGTAIFVEFKSTDASLGRSSALYSIGSPR